MDYFKGAWPIEFWDPRRGPMYKYFQVEDHYELPMRKQSRPKSCFQSFCRGRSGRQSQGRRRVYVRVFMPCKQGKRPGNAAADRFAVP